MKRTAAFLIAAITVLSMLSSCGENITETKTVEYGVTYLQNTYHNLTDVKKLNIAFIGGSITAGFGASSYEKCWAGMTEQWFKDNFADAEIKANNASFGGIGSDINAFRAYSELDLADRENSPDLLFVECSVNDAHIKTDSDTVKGYTEAMIRSVNMFAPECDIVYVFTSDFWRSNNDFDQRTAAIEVLDAYGIEYIDVGAPLFDIVISENGGNMPSDIQSEVMMKYFNDGIHPTDAGYEVYSTIITDWLSEKLININNLDKSAHSPHEYLSEPHFGDYSVSMTCTELSVFSDRMPGWTDDGNSLEINENTDFSFTFTGTGAYLWTNSYADGCIYTFEIDGTPIKKRTSMSKENENCYLVCAAAGLEYGEHTVKVNVLGFPSHSRIYGLCVAGDETHSGAEVIIKQDQ